eukprot:5343033-Pyramimonas_sp.AAC.1
MLRANQGVWLGEEARLRFGSMISRGRFTYLVFIARPWGDMPSVFSLAVPFPSRTYGCEVHGTSDL